MEKLEVKILDSRSIWYGRFFFLPFFLERLEKSWKVDQNKEHMKMVRDNQLILPTQILSRPKENILKNLEIIFFLFFREKLKLNF